MKSNKRIIFAGLFVVFGVALVTGVFSAIIPNFLDRRGIFIIFSVFVGLTGIAFVVFNIKGNAMTREKEKVVFDAEQVVRIMANGQTEAVRWDELQEVGILTTDGGPAVDDIFWLLIGENSKCVVPSEIKGMEELLSRLQQLPNFDNNTVIKAMGTTSNAKFTCW